MKEVLQEIIANLEDKKGLSGLPLREKIIALYHNRVLADLREMIHTTQDEEDLYTKVKTYLEQNWAFIKGSLLSYNALPQGDITVALSEVAKAMAEFKNKQKPSEPNLNILPIELLIPDIEVETYHEGYQGLDELDMPALFASHISSANHDSLIPVSIILDDITLRPYESSKMHKAESRYTLLINDEIPKLRRRLESQKGSMGEELTEVKLAETKQKLEDAIQQAGALELTISQSNQSEITRLIKHSSETLAVFNVRKELDRLKSDKSHLLGYLTELCKKLKLNDVTGVGKESSAGSGAYPAIFAFNEYYQSLEEGDKNKIPESLRDEIDKLLSLASDSTKNKNATENIETCIASRRLELERNMAGKETMLAAIACSDETKQKLIKEREKELSLAEESLAASLKEGTYQGVDKWPLTQRLIDGLKVDISIGSLAELDDFMTLEPEEIRGIGQQPATRKALTGIFKSVEELVIFTHEMPLEKVQVFLELTEPDLLARLCEQPEDGAVLLSSLENEKLVLLFHSALQNKHLNLNIVDLLSCKIDSPNELHRMISSLPLEKRQELIKGEYFNTALDQAAINSESLAIILDLFPEELRFEVIKGKDKNNRTLLSRIAFSPRSLKHVLELYPKEQRLEALREKDRYGNTAFNHAAYYLECIMVMLELLPKEQRIELVIKKNEYGNTTLHQFISDLELLKVVLDLLPQQQRFEAVTEEGRYGNTLHQAVLKPECLKVILDSLPEEQRLEAIKKKNGYGNTALHEAGSNLESLKLILDLYPKEQRLQAVTEEGRYGDTTLHQAAFQPECLKVLLDLLPEDQRLEALKIKDKHGNTPLQRAASSSRFLKVILDSAPKEQRLEVLKVKDRHGNTPLQCAVFNPELLKSILDLLPNEHRFEALNGKDNSAYSIFYLAIHSQTLLKAILVKLKPEERLKCAKNKYDGATPFIHGCISNPEIFKCLLAIIPKKDRHKAMAIKNDKGQSVNDVLTEQRPSLKQEITKMLPQENFSIASAVGTFFSDFVGSLNKIKTETKSNDNEPPTP